MQLIYSPPFNVAKDTKLDVFQHKIIHHILPKKCDSLEIQSKNMTNATILLITFPRINPFPFPLSAIWNFQVGYRCAPVPSLPFPVPRSKFCRRLLQSFYRLSSYQSFQKFNSTSKWYCTLPFFAFCDYCACAAVTMLPSRFPKVSDNSKYFGANQHNKVNDKHLCGLSREHFVSTMIYR